MLLNWTYKCVTSFNLIQVICIYVSLMIFTIKGINFLLEALSVLQSKSEKSSFE